MGLIQEVVADEHLMVRARELAQIMVEVPQSGMVADTESVLRNLGHSYEEGLSQEAIIGSTVEISGEALGRFVTRSYNPVTGGPQRDPSQSTLRPGGSADSGRR